MTVRTSTFCTQYDRETYLKAVADITKDIAAVPVTTKDPLAVVLKFIDRTLKADPKSSISCDRVYDCYCAWSLSMRIEPIPHHAFRDNLNHFVQDCLQGKVTHVQGEDDVYYGLTIQSNPTERHARAAGRGWFGRCTFASSQAQAS